MVRLAAMAACLLTALIMVILTIAGGVTLSDEPAKAPGPDMTAMAPKSLSWGHKGIFGTFDRAAAQRGLVVYVEVCAGCHSLKRVAFRSLAGIGLSADGIKAFAKEYDIADLDDEGEEKERPGKPSDYFPSPFANAKAAAAANNGTVPPDLSLIIKARAREEDYIVALMTGYTEPPSGVEISEGTNYNPYFEGRQIAMAAPLFEDSVEYADGTKATVEQLASDVAVFLAWAAEPSLEARKSMGVKVIIFLLIFAGLMYAVKKRVWADQH